MFRRRFKLKTFDTSSVKDDASIGIVAKRRSGKSTLIKDLVFKLKPSRIIAFIGSEAADTYYAMFIPPTYIYKIWDVEKLRAIINYQRENYDGSEAKSLTIVIDDFGFDKSVMKSKILRELFMNGRHLGIRIIIAFQYLKDLPRENRGNIDIMFVMKELNRDNQRSLFDEFFNQFPDFKTFRTVLQQATNNYGILVQDQTNSDTSLANSVFTYKADPHINIFTAGAKKTIRVAKRLVSNKYRSQIRTGESNSTVFDLG